MTRTDLLDRAVVPVASPEDGRATARAVGPHLRDGYAVVVHVVEKAGGAPDKASVEQREQYAEETFAAVRETFEARSVAHECHVLYGTDVAGRIVRAADEFDADAIAFTPRGGSRWLRLLTGDVGLSLVSSSDRPVVVLPDANGGDSDV